MPSTFSNTSLLRTEIRPNDQGNIFWGGRRYSFFSSPPSFFLSAFFFWGFKLFVNNAFVSSFVISTALLTFSGEYHTGAGVSRVVPVFVTATANETLSVMLGGRNARQGRTGDGEGRYGIARFGVVGNDLDVEGLEQTVLYAFANTEKHGICISTLFGSSPRSSRKCTHASFARPSFSKIRSGKGKAPAFLTISE